MNRLLFIDTGKTRPKSYKTRTISGPPPLSVWLRYSYYNPSCLLPSLPFHRLLGSPGLAKPTTGSPALPGVPTRLGTLL